MIWLVHESIMQACKTREDLMDEGLPSIWFEIDNETKKPFWFVDFTGNGQEMGTAPKKGN